MEQIHLGSRCHPSIGRTLGHLKHLRCKKGVAPSQPLLSAMSQTTQALKRTDLASSGQSASPTHATHSGPSSPSIHRGASSAHPLLSLRSQTCWQVPATQAGASSLQSLSPKHPTQLRPPAQNGVSPPHPPHSPHHRADRHCLHTGRWHHRNLHRPHTPRIGQPHWH